MTLEQAVRHALENCDTWTDGAAILVSEAYNIIAIPAAQLNEPDTVPDYWYAVTIERSAETISSGKTWHELDAFEQLWHVCETADMIEDDIYETWAELAEETPQ